MNYGVTPPGQLLALYVMTRSHLAKARNIARNHRIALVVPITRKLLWFLPPATLQLHGRAEILSWTDAEGKGSSDDSGWVDGSLAHTRKRAVKERRGSVS